MAPHSGIADHAAPLADYFFIAGIESSQVIDEKHQTAVPAPAAPAPVDTTIEENKVLETDTARPSSADGTPDTTTKRRSRLSYETRKSISSLLGSESLTASNRSSATIKVCQVESTPLSDADFDNALRKFAAERDHFLDEIHFSAGALPPISKPKRSKTQRIANDEAGLRNGAGSIRRRLSDMNSLKRQPSLMRQSSVRTSKRMSGYNSVIPNPTPLQTEPNMHPLRRRYEPVLLDRYPQKHGIEDLKKRSNFPDYVPMFAFPNDVSVVSSDERPRSSWHGFAMTNGDGSRLYGIVVTIWIPLNEKVSEELERQCEEWRRYNMTNEERELAASLGERLALERAKLSRMLARLPHLPQGTEERADHEEQINMVEEKIGLMTDLLRPVRHGAASKIEGLTNGGTGLWIPRAYGILGREARLTSFWKEWLKSIVVPMMNGSILRIPASSSRVGMWQPLERYVVNLCTESPSPITSATQVEIAIRELRLYARKEAPNELPGCRNTDLYALFRCLSIPNIITLFEYVLAESRIILLSSHTSMLHLASNAIISLIYPLQWSSVFIPVLPARLIQALEAPCPYIVGIERRYENVELPDDDYVLVDLDENVIESTCQPTMLPRAQRRKLIALLNVAAQHHTRYGVPVGPPPYAQEAFPCNSFCSENSFVFNSRPTSTTLSTLVSINSASFGSIDPAKASRPLVMNAFLQARNSNSRGSEINHGRPATSSTSSNSRMTAPSSPHLSPISGHFPQPSTPLSGNFPNPGTPVSRNDSGLGLQATLREKRSGHFDSPSRRSSSFGFDRMPIMQRRPSQPFLAHISTPSSSTLNSEFRAQSSYAPSVYAQSTLAASTIMPGTAFFGGPFMQSNFAASDGSSVSSEGHLFQPSTLTPSLAFDDRFSMVCSVCDEAGVDPQTEGMMRCRGCDMLVHPRCVGDVCIVCPNVFRPDQIRAAFVRCFASLFFTYRRFLGLADHQQRKNKMHYSFNLQGFMKSLPGECAEFMNVLQNTQAFNEFIHEREMHKADNPRIRLFDQIILSKKNRGARSHFLFNKASTGFLSDTSSHLWRTASAIYGSSNGTFASPNGVFGSMHSAANSTSTAGSFSGSGSAASAGGQRFPGDYKTVVSRTPAKLDPTLMKEPRVVQGAPRVLRTAAGVPGGAEFKTRRKPVIHVPNGG